jgi:hypothetical protein
MRGFLPSWDLLGPSRRVCAQLSGGVRSPELPFVLHSADLDWPDARVVGQSAYAESEVDSPGESTRIST